MMRTTRLFTGPIDGFFSESPLPRHQRLGTARRKRWDWALWAPRQNFRLRQYCTAAQVNIQILAISLIQRLSLFRRVSTATVG